MCLKKNKINNNKKQQQHKNPEITFSVHVSKSASSKLNGISIDCRCCSVPEIKITHDANIKVEINVPGLVSMVCACRLLDVLVALMQALDSSAGGGWLFSQCLRVKRDLSNQYLKLHVELPRDS